MKATFNGLGGGNCAIKGIIEEAKAKGIITAGDFVEYINSTEMTERSRYTV